MFWKRMKNLGMDLGEQFELCDSLKSVVERERLKLSSLEAALQVDESTGALAMEGRRPVFLFDGTRLASWEVDSLQSLFRGDEPAPKEVLSAYPLEFNHLFFEIERNLPLIVSESGRSPTDGEFLEIYSALRRRPDGRSLGALHDYVWTSVALMLGKYRCSESLYTAIMKRLEKSARTFKTGMSSRNYIRCIKTSR